MSKDKPILVLDFDGVINSYVSGWESATVILDPPVDGALDFISEAQLHFSVQILSSRSREPGGIEAMRAWMREWQEHLHPEWTIWLDEIIEWPTEKPAAFLTLDDRALTFDGHWPDVKTLLQFKPWYKR